MGKMTTARVKQGVNLLVFGAILPALWTIDGSAQVSTSEKCPGPIYSRKEVSKPAKIGHPNLSALHEAFGRDVSGRVKLEAVLCRSGRVTDIRVTDSQPPEIGEFVAAALSLMGFKPAELNWHTVSQRQQFEFSINQDGVSPIDSAAAAGRQIEDLDIMGNRRLTKDEILQLIRIRPGDIYSSDQVQKDLTALLARGYFNSKSTRVYLEDAARGGVRLVFDVFELPLIAEVRFEGLTEADASTIVEELLKQKVNVRKGAPLDPVALKQAARVIESFFASKGRDVKALAFVEELNGTESVITFKVTAYKPGPL